MVQLSSNQSDQLLAAWQQAEQRPFVGFDFSYFADKWMNEQPPWSYEALVRELMPTATAALDIGTGGGEKLLQFKDYFPPKLLATEGYPPNLRLAREQLAPLGVQVLEFEDSLEGVLPLADDSFDLVINRHSSFNSADVARLLKAGGAFLTQQVDGRNLSDLSAAFEAVQPWRFFTLDFVLARLDQTNLAIEIAQAWTGQLIFKDVATLVYYLKAVPWTVPGFSVEKHRSHLEKLQQRLEADGALRFTQRSMLIKATKEKPI
ncbi:MAG: class I SAM-dependent methyltransferase [Chloroflexi bacterium]|nr:class I SAM-dependent methyltransferase [Chloroflexota bacterium]